MDQNPPARSYRNDENPLGPVSPQSGEELVLLLTSAGILLGWTTGEITHLPPGGVHAAGVLMLREPIIAEQIVVPGKEISNPNVTLAFRSFFVDELAVLRENLVGFSRLLPDNPMAKMYLQVVTAKYSRITTLPPFSPGRLA